MSAPPRQSNGSTSDAAIFDQLFRRHGGELYAYCLHRTRDATRAQDLHATIFLEAWRRREEVDLISLPALPWLYGVAANLLRNEWRAARRRREAICRIADAAPGPAAAAGVVEQVERVELIDALVRAMRGLPAAQRTVLVLCVLEDRSYEAVARALEIPVGTVRSRLARARAQLAGEIGRPRRSVKTSASARSHNHNRQRSQSWPTNQT